MKILPSLVNRTLIVTTVLSAPYCLHKEGNIANLTGNDQYEGYAVDLIHEISQILNFKYEFKLVPDGHHGSLNRKTMEWDGLIRELLEKKADLAIADLTINTDRVQAVDFSMPFMELGISLLYRKPVTQPPNMFSFVLPLSPEVWACVATAYIIVSLILFLLSRLTPKKVYNKVDEESDILEKQPTLLNCFWFAMAPLTTQGCELLPRAISTRMVAAMWWFFSLIIISSYTANLVAFLTVELMDSPIKSVEDLARQTKIKYGLYVFGSTLTFFKEATSATYRQMWSFMETTRPSVFTNSNLEGVERVIKEKGNFAFLMESISIQYVIERNCELAQVGGQLDSKNYGIAMPKNSSYQTAINSAILKLQEKGILNVLKTRWWKQKRGGGLCNDQGKSSSANELGLAHLGGIFLLYFVGIVIALIVAVFELRKRRKHGILPPSNKSQASRKLKKNKISGFYVDGVPLYYYTP